jgi:hypothetical protein
MDNNNRNSYPGIFVIVLMIVFFSLFHNENERHGSGRSVPSSFVAGIDVCDFRAIPGPGISIPGNVVSPSNALHPNSALSDCISGREFVFSRRISVYLTSYQIRFPGKQPNPDLIFLQKIPGQGNEDDVLPNS